MLKILTIWQSKRQNLIFNLFVKKKRSDSSLQRLIYQLIPNLLENEIDRRKQYFSKNSIKSEFMLSNATVLNLKLLNNDARNRETPQINENQSSNNNLNENKDVYRTEKNVKYIQCMAQTPLRILVKLIRNKYNIPPIYSVIYYIELM